MEARARGLRERMGFFHGVRSLVSRAFPPSRRWSFDKRGTLFVRRLPLSKLDKRRTCLVFSRTKGFLRGRDLVLFARRRRRKKLRREKGVKKTSSRGESPRDHARKMIFTKTASRVARSGSSRLDVIIKFRSVFVNEARARVDARASYPVVDKRRDYGWASTHVGIIARI